MVLYLVGILRSYAGTEGESEISRRLWLISVSLSEKV